MVKFTFVSVFLVLTTMSALVFAAPTILPKYSIRVRFTEYFLFSNGLEKPGDRVTLVPGYNPSTTVVSITDLKPLGTFDAEVIGKAGLFVSVREDYLVWEREAYLWKFRDVTPFANYEITEIAKPLYWIKSNKDIDVHAGSGDVFTIAHV